MLKFWKFTISVVLLFYWNMNFITCSSNKKPGICNITYEQAIDKGRSINIPKIVCCDGYKLNIMQNLCIPTCKPNCENNGICSSPNNCTCVEGYYGNHCHLTYTNTSNQIKEICNKDSSQCTCGKGFFGLNCEKTCKPGTFGWHCTEKCTECKNYQICNRILGECRCKDECGGPNCSIPLESRGNSPTQCPGVCECEYNEICDRITDKCIPKPEEPDDNVRNNLNFQKNQITPTNYENTLPETMVSYKFANSVWPAVAQKPFFKKKCPDGYEWNKEISECLPQTSTSDYFAYVLIILFVIAITIISVLIILKL